MQVTRVLVVEDDSEILNMLWEALQRAGYFVQGAANGEEALTLVRYHTPHLVIADLMMPISSGIDLVAALRADPRYHDLPVIGISGALRPIAAAAGLLTTFLAKPFNVDELLATVEHVLDSSD
jgi:DNA-binding response OmpR family regulator